MDTALANEPSRGAHAAARAVAPALFDAAVLAFVASAALGYWTAHDAGAFTAAFWVIAAGAAAALVVAHLPSVRAVRSAAALFAALGITLAIRFLALNDWTDVMWSLRGDKLAPLDALFTRLASLTLPSLAFATEPDVAGGIAATALPFIALFAVRAYRRSQWAALAGWVLGAGVAGLMLFISLSYGAWLATAGAFGAWAAWRLTGRALRARGWDAGRAWRAQAVVLAALMALGILAYAALLLAPGLGNAPLIGGTAQRARTWFAALPLAQDYFFTGLGLGNFGRPYPIYAQLTAYWITPRTRNVAADVLIEQGILGLVSLTLAFAVALTLGLRALRRRPAHAALVEAGLASTLVTLANGLLNNPLHGSSAAALGGLLLFLPMAFVVAGARLAARANADATAPTAMPPRRRWIGLAGAAVMVFAIAAVALAGWRPLAASFHANLGAVEQARVEFAIHDPLIDNAPSLDYARRTGDLSRAVEEYRAALQLYSDNPVARVRLAQIALGRGEYDAALGHAQAAWDAGHRDPRTRLTLGDALVAAGRVPEAVQIVRGIGQANRRFYGQGWSRYMADKDYTRAAYAYAAAVAVDPNDGESAHMRAEAERMAREGQ